MVTWCAAQIHYNISLPITIRFIAFISDDNEGLNVINLMYLNLLNSVFINWHRFIFLINVVVNKLSAVIESNVPNNKMSELVSKLCPDTLSGSLGLEYKDTFVSQLAKAVILCL